MTPELREAFRYQLTYGGYATPPGRAACALERARAELVGRDSDTLRVIWEHDPDPDLSFDETGTTQRRVESGEWCVVGCVVESRCSECGEWRHAASLWGIIIDGDPFTDPHGRIVEAELMSEAVS